MKHRMKKTFAHIAALAMVVGVVAAGVGGNPAVAASGSGSIAGSRPGIEFPGVSPARHTPRYRIVKIRNESQASASRPSARALETPALDVEVTVVPDQLDQMQLVDTGVGVTVTGLQPGDKVTDELTGQTLTAAGDSLFFVIANQSGNPFVIDPGVVSFTVTVQRGDETKVVPAQFTLLPYTGDPNLGRKIDAPQSVPLSDFVGTGFGISGSGFSAGGDVYVYIVPEDWDAATAGPAGRAWPDNPVHADADGKFSTSAGVFPDQGPFTAGTYQLLVWDETFDLQILVPFTVTDDRGPVVYHPTLQAGHPLHLVPSPLDPVPPDPAGGAAPVHGDRVCRRHCVLRRGVRAWPGVCPVAARARQRPVAGHRQRHQ